MSNQFHRIVKKINCGPVWLRPFLLTKLFCSKVKYAGTSGVKLKHVSASEAILHIANKKRVQNHIGGVHAIAAGLLAESATGIVIGMNVPDDKIPLLKSMTVHYQRRMQGALTAKASLSSEQITLILSEDKGDVLIPVVITDESGSEPVACEMLWAWVPKKRTKP